MRNIRLHGGRDHFTLYGMQYVDNIYTSYLHIYLCLLVLWFVQLCSFRPCDA